MKKLFTFAVTVITALCLAACSMPMKNEDSRENGLNSSFQSAAVISLDRLQAEGTMKRFGDGVWEIEFSSPNTLSGVKLEFSEDNVNASYKGLNFSVPQAALPVKAMMLNLMRAVDENARLDELTGEDDEGMLKISGSIDGGDYVLTVDKNGNLAAFEMPNNELNMTFTDIVPIASASPESTSAEDSTQDNNSETTEENTTDGEAATETAAEATADTAEESIAEAIQ